MKIAIITDHIPLTWAHSINTMKLAQGFYKLGHEVDVLSVARWKEEINRVKVKDIQKFYDLDKSIRIKFFLDYSLDFFFETPFIGPIFHELWNILTKVLPKMKVLLDPEKKISDYCKNNKYDLTISRRTYTAVYYNILNEVPTIMDLHGYVGAEIPLLFKLSKSEFFKGIMTINHLLARKYEKMGISKEKVRVMDNCVNIEKYEKVTNNKSTLRKILKLPLQKTLILYSGSLLKKRGIDIILQTASMLKDKEYSFCFVGGNNKQIRYWNRYMRKLRIKADIRFLGWKEHDIIPYYLKAADILLSMYSSKTPTLGFMSPIKMIEYMASKVPLISVNVPRTKEICDKDECLFVKIDDPMDLKEKIKQLSSNKDLQQELLEKAYIKATNFSITNRCKVMLELINNK